MKDTFAPLRDIAYDCGFEAAATGKCMIPALDRNFVFLVFHKMENADNIIEYVQAWHKGFERRREEGK
jgi:hypothetical protein